MYKLIFTLLVSTVLAGTAAWAEDQSSDQSTTTVTQPSGQQPGEVASEQAVGTTERRAEQVSEKGYLRDEIIGLRPQIGAFLYKNPITDTTQARGALGVTMDANLLSVFSSNKDWYLGPSTGFIFSHVGPGDANFFGANSSSANQGANMFVIPMNAKLGYNLSRDARVSLHGGGNLIYRSIPQAVSLSNTDSTKGPNDWTPFYNVGADFEYGFGNSNIALLIRPDWTFATGNDMLTGTVALSIALG